MDVLSLQIFVSLILVLFSILLFAHAAKSRSQDHSDRLALLPLEEDHEAPATDTTGAPTPHSRLPPRTPQ